MSPVSSRLLVLSAALLFSTGGAAIKATAFSAWQVASFRSGIAAIALFLLLPAWRRGWSKRTLLVGLFYAITLILYVTANKLTTAANSIFLQATAPLYLLLLAPRLLGEPLRQRDPLLAALLVVGIVLFFVQVDPALATAPRSPSLPRWPCWAWPSRDSAGKSANAARPETHRF